MSLTNEIVIIRLAANNKYVPNRLSAGASPQTPLGELTALPRPPSWFRGGAPGKGKKGGDAKKEGGEGKGGEGVPECQNRELASLLRRPARLASGSCGRHEYSRWTRQTTDVVRRASSLNAPYLYGRGMTRSTYNCPKILV